MNSLYEDVFSTVRAALYGTEPKINEDTDRVEYYKAMRRTKLTATSYKTVSDNREKLAIPESVLSMWKSEMFSRTMAQMFVFSELKKVIEGAKEQNLTMIMFKGIGLAKLYPDPNHRYSTDSDILIYPEDRERATKYLESIGYKSIGEGSKNHVPIFDKKSGGLISRIELHDCLWEDYEGKQAQLLESLELSKRESLITDTFIGCEYTTLGISEHLIYQIFHIVKHLFFEGISLRYFTDITLYVNKYNSEIDWKKVRGALKTLHYERFLDCILTICQDNLGMTKDVPGIEPVEDVMKEHLIEDVLAERAPQSEKDTWETINFLERYFMRDTAVKESKFNQKRKQILPLPSELNEKYSYAKKCPILLPVAWIHRVFYFIGYKRDCKKYGKDADGAMKKSQQRLDLMRELNLMDTDKDIKN